MERTEFERICAVQRELLINKALAKKQKDAEKDGRGLSGSDITLSDAEIVEIEKKLPANPRNLTAGTMKLLDADILNSRSLKAIFYSVGIIEGVEIKFQHDLPRMLADWGLPSVNWYKTAEGAKGAFEKIEELEEVRSDFPFNTDGAVVKLDDCSLHEKAA